MRKLFLLLLLSTSFGLLAQTDIVGQWVGTLDIQGVKLRVVFNVTQSEEGYKTTMDSPDQGVKDIPFTNTVVEYPKVKFEIPNAIEYTGEVENNSINGVMSQAGESFKLVMTKNTSNESIVRRPQEPKTPFAYYSEDVSFRNENANIKLAGTLTLPKKEGNFPVVVLISGSGPQNRDSEVLGHKPFLVWADYLTKNGIAVLRFDERGVAESEGDFNSATTNDFASDVQSAVAFLKTRKEINKNKIGLLGHSEGGVVAPMVAVSNPKDISFIVMLSGSGLKGSELMLFQQKAIARAAGAPEEFVQRNFEMHNKIFQKIDAENDLNKLNEEIPTIISQYISQGEIPEGMTKDQMAFAQAQIYLTPWMLNFLRYDPTEVLGKVKCPVLAINGEKDLQITSKENLTAIKSAINKGGNKKVTTVEYPNLNHLFQECQTGLPQEYSYIEQTISEKVLEDVTLWIKNQTK